MRPWTLLSLALVIACGGKDDDSATNPTGPTNEGPLQYAPIAQYDEYRFEDYNVLQHIPNDPRGVVIFFHGSDGGVGVVRRIEVIAFLNELIVEGIGFVATESADRATGKWDDADVERVGRLYEQVLADTDLEPTDALFTAGFSGGGRMTGDFAGYAQDQGWNIRASNPNQSGCASCRDDIPTFFVISENDLDPHGTANSRHDALKAAGTPTKLRMVEEKILDVDSFTKHPDMTAERSQRVFEDLIAKEFVDADGVRIVPDAEMEQYCTWYANNGDSFGPSYRADELRVLWGMHRYSGEYAREVRDFFLDRM